ncbi:MAG: M43 family zinc metalloprotease [Bacteroidota bacterium]
MKVFLLSILIVLLSLGRSVSQHHRNCGTRIFGSHSFQKTSSLPARNHLLGPLESVSLPVIVHILYEGEEVGSGRNISPAQVYSQFEVLNEDFNREEGTPGFNNNPVGASLNIRFLTAKQDTCQNNLVEEGIERIDRREKGFLPPPYTRTYLEEVILPATIWDPEKYLNIWVCELSNNVQGIAQFPDSSGLPGIPLVNGNPDGDGIIVDFQAFGRVGNVVPPFDQGRTTTHELGHWLGLIHTWGDGGCSDDDFCEDTPLADVPTNGCPVNKFSCGSADMVENYMDFTDDVCMNIFTLDQKARVMQVLANSPRRGILNSSPVASPSAVLPTPAFSSSMKQICPGSSISFRDESKGNPTSWLWTFEGGTPSQSFERNPQVRYNGAGVFSVSLSVENEQGLQEITLDSLIQVNPDLTEAVWFGEDFEKGLGGWTIENPDGKITWEQTFVGGSSKGSSVAVLRHYDYLDRGARDKLISPSIDLTAQDAPRLTIEYAYQSFGSGRRDSLLISVLEESTGTVFPLSAFGEDGSGNFATAGESNIAFIPSSSNDWCKESELSPGCIELDLASFSGKAIKLIFETVNDFGNNLYLDNIRVLGNCTPPVTNLLSNLGDKKLRIFPNPCQTDCRILVPNGLDSAILMEVVDLQGNIVLKKRMGDHVRGGEISFSHTLSTGIYLIIFHARGEIYTEKLLVY